MIKKIPVEEYTQIYKNHIVRDFPRNERRPLFLVKRLYKKGLYSCYVSYHGEEIAAYACILRCKGLNSVLLDYYAVEPQMRGTGIGGGFLQELGKMLDCDGIVMECEMPCKAENEQEKTIRERRIRFYERNGAELSSYGWYAFKVDYNLLWMPINKELGDRNLGEEMCKFYTNYIPNWVNTKNAYRYYTVEN